MKKNKLFVGLVGCGAIGSHVARAVQTELSEAFTLVGICDVNLDRADRLNERLEKPVPVVSLPALAEAADLLIEAASVQAVADVLRYAAEGEADAVIVSVGGLTPELIREFEDKGRTLHVPSGAIAGIDGLLAARAAGVRSVEITTRKPPKALENSQWFQERGLKGEDIEVEETVFEGPAEEAIKHFPKNVNVSSALKLAGGEPVRVRLIADPKARTNVHEIRFEADFGKIEIRVESAPSPENPGTSALACHSVVALLRKLVSGFKMGV